MHRLLLLAALAAAPATTFAVPVTIDVTGRVFLYQTFDDSDTGVDLIATLPNLDAAATFTFDTELGPTPFTDDFGNGLYEQFSVGLPLADFILGSVTWAGGTYVPAPMLVPAGATAVGDFLELLNFTESDFLYLDDQYGWQDEDISGVLSRAALSFEDDFLPNDAGIPTGSERPNLATATARVVIQAFNFSTDFDEFSGTFDERLTGYQVGIDVTSATYRAVAVPEPGTLALLAAGLASLALLRRRGGAAKGFATGTLLLGAAASPAMAEVITQSVSFGTTFAQGHQTMDIDETFSLDAFDASLGTLQSVSIDLTTALLGQSILASISCDSEHPGCNVFSRHHLASSETFVLKIGDSSDWEARGRHQTESPDVSCEGVGACVAVGPLPDIDSSYGFFFDDAAHLGLFEGSGAYDLTYSFFGTSCAGSSLGGGESPCTYLGSLRMSGTVVYDYLEAVAVAEPASVPLLGSGLGLLLLVGLGRRRFC